MPEEALSNETTERNAPQWLVVAGLGSLSLFEVGVGVYQFVNEHTTSGVGALVAAAILGGVGALEATGRLPQQNPSRIQGRY